MAGPRAKGLRAENAKAVTVRLDQGRLFGASTSFFLRKRPLLGNKKLENRFEWLQTGY